MFYLLELVFAISLISFGSNQTFFLPHRITEAASLFCNLRELETNKQKYQLGIVVSVAFDLILGGLVTEQTLILSES